MLRTVQVKPIGEADDVFKQHQKRFQDELSAKIPQELRLPGHLIDNPPQNVLGVPAECGLLTQSELDISEKYDVVALVEAIAQRKLTSAAVVTAFAKRAAIAHQLTSCLTDWFLDEALVRAKELDEHLEKTGKTVGPLHGVPISIKEMVPLKGRVTSLGLVVSRHVSEEDCQYVASLRSLGAVFYVKTNEPTGVLSPECTSFMGRTLNPYNIKTSCGGSSGGEAALIAMRGSIFGIGTDIAGSIRVPASWCGLYGFKPSTGFISTANIIEGPFSSNLNCDGILGPLAVSLRDLDYVSRAVHATQPWLRDPDVLPIPYTGLGSNIGEARKLKIGIIKTDSEVHPMPPITQALEWVESELRSSGFAVTDFIPFSSKEASDLEASFMFVDAAQGLHAGLAAGHEPYWPMLEEAFINWANTATGSKVMSGDDVAERRYALEQARFRLCEHWQAQGDPDIVIGPAHMSTAPPHDSPDFFNYVSQWNLSDSPTLVIPTPFKSTKGATFIADYAGSPTDADRLAKERWASLEYGSTPVGLCIAAKRHHENVLTAAAGALQPVLKLP